MAPVGTPCFDLCRHPSGTRPAKISTGLVGSPPSPPPQSIRPEGGVSCRPRASRVRLSVNFPLDCLRLADCLDARNDFGYLPILWHTVLDHMIISVIW